ncbi:MAG TPA: GWxTD domain-containing protein [Thermoanaerobaculia bacterium]|nr:GWxTD domain-containing protein [Thermoanaerobaculia bacterium]
MRPFRIVALVLALAAPAAAAGFSKYKDWADSPQAYFLSKAEREQWGSINSDEAAEKFIAEYQAARGKGFAAAIQSRIDVADKTYKNGKPKGARSPQGKTLVLLGNPNFTEMKSGKEKTVADPSGAAGLSYSGEGSKGGGGGGTANPLSNTGGPGPNTLRGMEKPEPAVIRWTYQGSSAPPGTGLKEYVVTFDQDAAGNVTFQDPQNVEEVFQKVIAYWAPKPKR